MSLNSLYIVAGILTLGSMVVVCWNCGFAAPRGRWAAVQRNQVQQGAEPAWVRALNDSMALAAQHADAVVNGAANNLHPAFDRVLPAQGDMVHQAVDNGGQDNLLDRFFRNLGNYNAPGELLLAILAHH